MARLSPTLCHAYALGKACAIAAIGTGLLVAAGPQVRAQDYPRQTIRIVVSLAAGGIADQLARVLALGLTERAGATAIVENRTGGGGSIGADVVAKAAPDGYTLFVGLHATQAILPHLDAKLPYDPRTDFAPIVFLAIGPNVMVINPGLPATTVAGLVALAKSKPGTMSYASGGVGSSSHLVAEQFKIATGIDLAHVPYRGQAPANQDVVAGHVQMTFDIVGLTVASVRDGQLRALGITGDKRSAFLPDVPTMAEAGYPSIQGGPWFALFAPARTPVAVIDWLNARANEIFAAPAAAKAFTEQGMTMPLGSPEALASHVAAEYKRWGDVIAKAGIKLP